MVSSPKKSPQMISPVKPKKSYKSECLYRRANERKKQAISEAKAAGISWLLKDKATFLLDEPSDIQSQDMFAPVDSPTISKPRSMNLFTLGKRITP
jgi:hypothetical protein